MTPTNRGLFKDYTKHNLKSVIDAVRNGMTIQTAGPGKTFKIPKTTLFKNVNASIPNLKHTVFSQRSKMEFVCLN